MAEGQIYPPQILRGLDSFMQKLSPDLTEVSITKSRTEELCIDVSAIWKPEGRSAGVPLSIYWRHAKHYVSVGPRESQITNGKIALDDLGFGELEPSCAVIALRAIHELLALYDKALQIWDSYLDDSEDYVIARLDAAAQKRTRPTRELRTKLAARAGTKGDDVRD